MSGGVDDERVAIESLDHNGILCTQVVCREGIGLPFETLICIGEVLRGMREREKGEIVREGEEGFKAFPGYGRPLLSVLIMYMSTSVSERPCGMRA